MPQSKWIAIADSPDRLLLTTHDQGLAGFTTLARVSDDGKELWRASPPDPQDSWVDVEESEGRVIATSWSCWRITLEADTGRETSRVFTK